MQTEIKTYHLKRRKLGPVLDFGGFFAFFGVSGTDHGREERMNKRFEQEYFANIVTLVLSQPLAAGTYQFAGLPELVNRRGWKVEGGHAATCDLSDDGLEEFRAWMSSKVRRVEAVRVG
ncbi:hypothetical protein Dxin01_01481 [Deinococcus xinjiangensis]|uniref:Uncharacterized protein n=1 Tax=Deinococcus xinjiangensis TaxID=457454 RepID=A0ABP9VDE4_9DEIO